MNRRVLLIGLAIACPIVLILFVNLWRDPHEIRSPLIGRKAPLFELRESGGSSIVSLHAFAGTPVVLNFWATWCVPCHAEHELLVTVARQAGDNVRFIGIVYDDDEVKIQKFLADYGTSYPSLLDAAGETAIAYGVNGVPETFFIDRGGMIVAKFKGPLTPETLAKNLTLAAGGRS